MRTFVVRRFCHRLSLCQGWVIGPWVGSTALSRLFRPSLQSSDSQIATAQLRRPGLVRDMLSVVFFVKGVADFPRVHVLWTPAKLPWQQSNAHK